MTQEERMLLVLRMRQWAAIARSQARDARLEAVYDTRITSDETVRWAEQRERYARECDEVATALLAPPTAEAARVLEEVRDDYHARIGRWLSPALNTPTKEDLLTVIGHANAAFDAKLAAVRAPGAADAH